MARVELTEDDRNWLRERHWQETYPDMAQRIGCCVDTIKRILVREGLQEFDGAKYQVKRHNHVRQWTRPCLDCQSTELRPRMWFYCTPCRKKRGHTDE